jgi:hypothetical protein
MKAPTARSSDRLPSGMDDNEATRSSPANEEGRATEGEAIASLASTAAETPDKAATEDYNRKRRLETGNDDE